MGSVGANKSGVVNRIDASEPAVGFISNALTDIRIYGTAQIVINETRATTMKERKISAANPKNVELEKELQKLAADNNLDINFQTKSRNESGVRRELKYGSERERRQIKQRIMYAYPKRGK